MVVVMEVPVFTIRLYSIVLSDRLHSHIPAHPSDIPRLPAPTATKSRAPPSAALPRLLVALGRRLLRAT